MGKNQSDDITTTSWEICVNGVSIIFGLTSWIIKVLYNTINPELWNWLNFIVHILVSISWPPVTNERKLCFNRFCWGTVTYTATRYTAGFLNWVIYSQLLQCVIVYNFTNVVQCLTGKMLFMLVALESSPRKGLATLIEHNNWQSLKSKYLAFKFLL